MADGENKIKKWIKKWQKDNGHTGAGEESPHNTGPAENLREAADKGDIGAGEESPHNTGPAENLREAADKGDIGAGEESPHNTGPAENLREAADKGDIGAGEESPHNTGPAENPREAAENLREEAAKVDLDEKSGDNMSPQNKAEHEPISVNRDQINPEIVEKRKSWTGILAGRPIVVLLIIGAIVLGGFLLYSQIQLSNQSYKIENFNALWNQSLADLRTGNTSIDEYCLNRVHDEELCNRFKNLQYMG